MQFQIVFLYKSLSEHIILFPKKQDICTGEEETTCIISMTSSSMSLCLKENEHAYCSMSCKKDAWWIVNSVLWTTMSLVSIYSTVFLKDSYSQCFSLLILVKIKTIATYFMFLLMEITCTCFSPVQFVGSWEAVSWGVICMMKGMND